MITAAVIVFLGIVTVALFATFVGLPTLPGELGSVLAWATGILAAGFKVLNTFCYAPVVIALWAFSTILFNVKKAYDLFMWGAEKVPMWGVK